MLQKLGYACYGFAVLDLGLYWLGIADLTGVSWSPIAAFVVGSVLVKAGSAEGSDAQPQPGVAKQP